MMNWNVFTYVWTGHAFTQMVHQFATEADARGAAAKRNASGSFTHAVVRRVAL